MSFAAVIEAGDRAPERRPIYVIGLLLAMLAVLALRAAQFFSTAHKPPHTDFDAFHLAARMVLNGNIDEAYTMAGFIANQKALMGSTYNLAWTYPPPFDLFVAPLGLVSLPLAFTLFMAASLVAYLLTLRRLAGGARSTLLILMFLPIYIVIIFGQNGFLTGTLIGLACLGLKDRKAWAGIPLGLMIIKPHLAIGLAFYVVISRNWGAFVTAAATVGIMAALSTLMLGPDIWPAFLGGVRETSDMLQSGRYPLFRMLSPFATVRSLGASAPLAFAVQAAVAILALAIIWLAHRRLPAAQALGVATIASLLISPYVYDYDLGMMGVGLALLLPAILADGRPWERSLFYALFLAMSGYGLAQVVRLDELKAWEKGFPPTITALALIGCLALVWRILDRQTEQGRTEADPLPAPATAPQ